MSFAKISSFFSAVDSLSQLGALGASAVASGEDPTGALAHIDAVLAALGQNPVPVPPGTLVASGTSGIPSTVAPVVPLAPGGIMSGITDALGKAQSVLGGFLGAASTIVGAASAIAGTVGSVVAPLSKI